MRVFITGGSGLIGRNLARTLLRIGAPARDPLPPGGRGPARSGDVGRTRWSRAIRRRRAAGRTRSTAATPSSTSPAITSSPSAGARRSRRRSATAGSTPPSSWSRRSNRRSPGRKVFVQGSAIGYLRAPRRRRADRSQPARVRLPGARLPRDRGGLASRSRAWACAAPSSGPGSSWRRTRAR